MRLIDALLTRIDDWLREVRIQALAALVDFHTNAGQPGLAQEAWQAMKAEINQRSPEQIARMERAKGLPL